MTTSFDHSVSSQQVVLVTGPAGAGRTTAIHVLEDLGFEAIDNIPLLLLPRLLAGPPVGRPMVLGVDPRTRDFDAVRLGKLLDGLAADIAVNPTLLFVDCSPEVLIRRFSETRRRHPSSPDGSPGEGIEQEIAVMAPLRDRADVLIDTSGMTPHQLRAELTRWFGRDEPAALAITLQSFSYKRGTPRAADMVIDCRFLGNPYWQPGLRPLDGTHQAVRDFVTADPGYAPFMERLGDLVRFLLPLYRTEGKAYFTLALGCTGGRHRSVMVTESLAKTLAQDGWRVSIRHRDVVRGGAGNDVLARVGAR